LLAVMVNDKMRLIMPRFDTKNKFRDLREAMTFSPGGPDARCVIVEKLKTGECRITDRYRKGGEQS